jgi:hypothetical protein
MNTTTRRIATALAGTALAASVSAIAVPAAMAAPARGIQMSESGSLDMVTGAYSLTSEYTVPVGASSVTGITCSLDGVPLASCGIKVDVRSTKKSTFYEYSRVVSGNINDGFTEHVFSVTVTTSKSAYTGSHTVKFLW